MLGIGERKARRNARELKAKRLARIERVKRYLENKFDRASVELAKVTGHDFDSFEKQWTIYRTMLDMDSAYRKLEQIEIWLKDN